MDIIARSARSDKTFSNIARPWVTVGYSIQPAQVGGKIPRYVHKDKHTAWETKGEQLTAESADFARRHPRDNGLLLLRNWHDRSRDVLVVDFDDLRPPVDPPRWGAGGRALLLPHGARTPGEVSPAELRVQAGH